MSVVTHTYRFSGLGEDFGPRKGSGLVILHTTEGSATAIDVTAALALAKWQDGDDTAGSYNRLIASDGVVSCVPDDHASGGVNPFSSYFRPVSWLYQHLPAYKVGDPNAYALQLAFMGRRAHFDANGWPPAMIDRAARSILEEEARIGGPVVVANHADFQPGNRTDAGPVAMDLVMKRYAELTATLPDTSLPEDDMTIRNPIVREQWTTRTGEFGYFRRADGTTGQFFTPEKVWSVAELTLSDGADARLLDYGPKHEALVMLRAHLVPVPGTRIVGGTVEVIKEVPTDCTPQVNVARQTTADKANAQMDAWTAARPRIVP